MNYVNDIIKVMGFDPSQKFQTTLNFPSDQPRDWKIYTFDCHFPFYTVLAKNSKINDIKNFVMSLKNNIFIIIFETLESVYFCINRTKKGEQPLVVPVRSLDDYDKISNVLKKHNFLTDELSAHMAIDSARTLLSAGAERYFINRGLFSNYFLKERMDSALIQRKRDIKKETSQLFTNLKSKNLFESTAIDNENISKILNFLGYSLIQKEDNKYLLQTNDGRISSIAIITGQDNLDIKIDSHTPVPSVQAVSTLQTHPWVILTNGRIWRLYSSKVSSSSTNYFEIDLEGITDEKDQKLKYFVSLFGSSALEVKNGGVNDLDFIYDGGLAYAKELEDNLRIKIFEKQLFLDLVRGIISHSKSKTITEDELTKAKAVSLKLLYRILFILYAESRGLLPINHRGYKEISFETLRSRLHTLEKDSSSDSVWLYLKNLFNSISNGNSKANLPQYNGSLFEYDENLDGLNIHNKYLVSALLALVEIDGKGIDYQNLGVRHLGSLYEALLEYSIKQASSYLAVVKDEIIDVSFISDLKSKPSQTIEKGELYLVKGGLARQGTGSYYTHEEIVNFLIRNGLEHTFKDRECKFFESLKTWRKSKKSEDASTCIEFLFDIQVLDPAMGSGHFLVKTVDEITKWIMTLLEKYPDAPLVHEIELDRIKVLTEQKNKGISINEDLLTFNVMLKRKVMKRCVFGVDINPLAVELAKLSLWLDSFTIGTPLTFLDHHIKNGNGIMGLWLQNLEEKKEKNINTTLDMWMESVIDKVSNFGKSLYDISIPPDLTLKDFNKNKETYFEFVERSRPFKIILDILTAGIIDSEIEKNIPKNYEELVDAITKNNITELKKEEWYKIFLKSETYSQKYHFFHWELEFPDAFTDHRRGFDIIITNPPWNTVKPDDDDFFSEYDSKFRKKTSKEDKKKIKEKLLKNPKIANSYYDYLKSINEQISFFKNSNEYVMRGTGDIDLWKIFLERISYLVSKNGTLSLVMPSGLLNNEGGKDLRKLLLEKKIRFLYEFHNLKGIFGIHRDYKFVLLIIDNVKSDSDFPAAFYLQDINALVGNTEQEKFFKLNKNFIQLIAPETFSIPELRGKYEIELFKKLYKYPLLSQGLVDKEISLRFVREMDKTKSSHLFRRDIIGWPLIEGKNFHQFNPDYKKVEFNVKPNEGLDWTSKIRVYRSCNRLFHEIPRLAFRNFGGSTNIRSIIACILPPKCFVPNNASIVVPLKDTKLLLKDEYYFIISYLAGILNSYVFDFLVFRRVFMNINYFLIYPTPIPTILDNNLAKKIIKISAQLSCKDSRFDKLAKIIGISSRTYSMREMIDMVAELNALVAHLYNLNRKEYKYIIDTFEDFTEDDNIQNLKEINWNESLIKKFNGEARKKTLKYYDEIVENKK